MGVRFSVTAELGTRDKRPLFRPPERFMGEGGPRLDDEADAEWVRRRPETEEEWAKRLERYQQTAAVEVEFAYLSNERVDYWEDRGAAIALEERKRVLNLRKEHSSETWPALHREGFRTSQKRDEDLAFAREYLEEAQAKLLGIDINGKRSEDLSSGEAIDLLVRMRWHAQAVAVIQRAQVPTVEQFLS